jgi:predicted nucleic acid-binding protein
VYFVDTSALVQAYVKQEATRTVEEAIALLGGSLFISDLVAVETFGVLAKEWRAGRISSRNYQGARRQLHFDLVHTYGVVPIEPALFPVSFGLVHAYRRHAAGGVDLLHIATAEWLQTVYPAENVHLMTCDGAQAAVAVSRGFEVFDPHIGRIDELDRTPLGL